MIRHVFRWISVAVIVFITADMPCTFGMKLAPQTRMSNRESLIRKAVEDLRVTDTELKGRTILRLVEMGESAVAKLFDILKEEKDAGIRRTIIRVVGEIGCRASPEGADLVSERLVEAMADKALETVAFSALLDYRLKIGPMGRQALFRALRESDSSSQCFYAGEVVKRLGGATAESIPDLIRIIRRNERGDRGRIIAEEIISDVGPVAAPFLAEAVEYGRGDFRRTILDIVLNSKRLPPEKVAWILAKILDDQNPEISDRVRRRLAEIGAPALPVLIEALESRYWSIRLYATQTICALDTRIASQAIPALERAVEDDTLLAVKLGAMAALQIIRERIRVDSPDMAGRLEGSAALRGGA